MPALIYLGFRQGHAGKEQRPEGIGSAGVIWKENRDPLISASFRPAPSQEAKANIAQGPAPPATEICCFVLPTLEKIDSKV